MLTLVTSDRFTGHLTPPGHPERVERAEVMRVVAAEAGRAGWTLVEPRMATDDELQRIHAEAYLQEVAATAGRAVAFDSDTVTSPETVDLARLAAGAACQSVDLVVGGTARIAVALVRPPGHHAEAARAMGFCFFNNIAVAAAHARSRGVARVAIVDFDVHHGNGTQHSFESDPSVLFVSTHQSPCYPGTGAVHECGVGAGEGYSVNLPMEAGCGDADYAVVFDRVVIPVVRQFRPELLLVSAGFDAHGADPLAGMRMSSEGFGELARRLVSVADEVCGGRLVAVTEGGYNLPALAASLRAFIAGLGAGSAPVPVTPPAGRGERALAQAVSVLSRYWRL